MTLIMDPIVKMNNKKNCKKKLIIKVLEWCWKKKETACKSLIYKPFNVSLSGPERTRTSDTQFRKLVFYPAELRDHYLISVLYRCLAASLCCHTDWVVVPEK